MPLKLTKTDQTRKTELMAAAWEKHAAMCEQIDQFNSKAQEERAAIEAFAGTAYEDALTALREFAEGIAADANEAFAVKSERWQQCDKGEAARAWIDAYEAFDPERPEIEWPNEVEHPSDGVLTEFEELGDAP